MSKGLQECSRRWFRLLQYLYPPDFRSEMGNALVEAYVDRACAAQARGGVQAVFWLWSRALLDSVRNGMAERFRPVASWRRAGNWGRDAELVTRRLLRSPVFAATTIATLSIGLGMFAVVYTAVQKILLDPMPYKDSGDLYYVWRDHGAATDQRRASLIGTDVIELQKQNGVIEGAAGLAPFLGGIFSLGGSAEPLEIAVTWSSPNLFQLLGIAPRLGRSFAPDETGPGRGQVIILTHQLWTRLGADPGIVGRDVFLQGNRRTVIGVLPKEFAFVRNDSAAPPQRVDAYVPFDFRLDDNRQGGRTYAGLIRARRGARPETVAAAVDAVGRLVDARDFDSRGLKLYPVAIQADVISGIRPALIALAASAGVLLLMLMVNLASVLLARAAQREHELAVSRALGANSAAIARSTLLEGGLLGLAGGAIGATAAVWAAKVLVALAPLDLPRREALVMDWRVAAVVVFVGIVLGLLAACAPAIWAVRTTLSSLLAASAVRGGGGHGKLRRAMIVTQVALSIVLLSSGALVAQSFARLLKVHPGFEPGGLFTVKLRSPPEFFPSGRELIEFQERVQASLASIPGVTGTSAVSTLPLTALVFQAAITAPGAKGNTGDPEHDRMLADILTAYPNYVEVMKMRLVAGRTFSGARRSDVLEAIVDRGVVSRFFPEGNPIGATLRVFNQNAVIIGVVEQARIYGVHENGRPQILIRITETFGSRPLFYVMRTTRDPGTLLPEVQGAVRSIDPRVPVGDPQSMQEIVDRVLSPQAIGTSMLGAFAIGAVLLAAMGLFGVVSGSMVRRRRELAVRLALGADQGRLLRLVVREGMLLVVIGLVVGAPGIYVANRVLRGLIVGMSPSDPVTLLLAAGGLLAVTIATCYLPARRALRIDPAELLRSE